MIWVEFKTKNALRLENQRYWFFANTKRFFISLWSVGSRQFAVCSQKSV